MSRLVCTICNQIKRLVEADLNGNKILVCKDCKKEIENKNK